MILLVLTLTLLAHLHQKNMDLNQVFLCQYSVLKMSLNFPDAFYIILKCFTNHPGSDVLWKMSYIFLYPGEMFRYTLHGNSISCIQISSIIPAVSHSSGLDLQHLHFFCVQECLERSWAKLQLCAEQKSFNNSNSFLFWSVFTPETSTFILLAHGSLQSTPSDKWDCVYSLI